MKRQISFRLGDKTVQRVQEIADVLGIDKTAVLEIAVAFFHRMVFEPLWGEEEFEAEVEGIAERVRLEDDGDVVHLDFGDRGVFFSK